MNRDRKFRRLDERKRISLNGIADHEYYEIQVSGNGSGDIILRPVSVVPAYLARQLREAEGVVAR